jgi:hypothetical protein
MRNQPWLPDPDFTPRQNLTWFVVFVACMAGAKLAFTALIH